MCNVNFPGNLEKFPRILFIQNSSARCAHEWNMTEISIDCHLAKGVRLQNLAIYNFFPFLCTMYSWKTGVFRNSFIQNGSAMLSVHMSGIRLKFSLIAT